MIPEEFDGAADRLRLDLVVILVRGQIASNRADGRICLHALLEREHVNVLALWHVVIQINVREPLLAAVEGLNEYGHIAGNDRIHVQIASRV